MKTTAVQKSTFSQAQEYLTSGLSLFPIRSDGTKQPAVKWKPFQTQLPTERDLFYWYEMRQSEKLGIAIVCGAISQNLEVVDFDNAKIFEEWKLAIMKLNPDLLEKLVIVRTPRPGIHVFYRCCTIGRNEKLAWVKADDGKSTIAIETRGEGGYVLAAGSPRECHPTGKRYRVISVRPLTKIRRITSLERDLILATARSLGSGGPATKSAQARSKRSTEIGTPFVPAAPSSDRPGDLYAAATPWEKILRPHGWAVECSLPDGTVHWTRPGKDTGTSATTNHNGRDLLHVFSSNAEPFEPNCGYSKFRAYALLGHDGDYGAAASELATQGYCAPKRKRVPRHMRRATPRRAAAVRRASVSRKWSNKRR